MKDKIEAHCIALRQRTEIILSNKEPPTSVTKAVQKGVRNPFLSQAITIAPSDQSAVAIKPALHAN